VVPYAYVVTNTGNVTLTGVTLADNNTDATPVCVPAQPATLAPGAVMNCTAQHTVTQAEINAGGNLTNTATADSNETGPAQDTLDIPIVTGPAIDLVKTGSLNVGPDGVATPGDLITYSFKVTNIGNVTLSNVSVTDPMVAPITCPGGNPIPSLAVGAMVTCSGTYAITQADINAGQKVNTATASGQDPAGAPVSDTDTATVPITQVPQIQLIKLGTLDPGPDGVPTPGDLIDYTFTVTNIGNVLLVNITVSDPLVAPITCPGGNPIPSLAVGASVVCTGSYAITQADIDAGERPNTATATGTGLDIVVTDNDSNTVPLVTSVIPTLGEWGLALFALLLLGASWVALRRQRVHSR